MRGVAERRELSSIAYGFMASTALFAALGVDLFTHLAAGPRTTAELSPRHPVSRRTGCGRPVRAAARPRLHARGE